MKRLTIIFLLTLILITSCDSNTITALPPTAIDSVTSETSATLKAIPLQAGFGADGGWFQLYFTDPTSPISLQKTGGIDGPLADAIDLAKLTVDVAVYSLSLNSIRDALLRAWDRGVRVRMVMESDNMDRTDPQILKEAGIPIVGDRREGLMHNKFIVIDNAEVWTGSMNYTDSGAYEDNNNMIRIHSVKLAEDYTKEFEEMFIDDKFGDNVVAATPNPRVTIDGTPVDVYFAPDDNVQGSLVEIVQHARESIYFMAFSFTADPIGDAVRARALDGVTVAGVMDDAQVNSNAGTEFDPFSQAGFSVYRDGNPGQMHHKVMIIDQNIVILGSYNFTASADTRNDENLLVIYNKEIASLYFFEFERVFGQAQ